LHPASGKLWSKARALNRIAGTGAGITLPPKGAAGLIHSDTVWASDCPVVRGFEIRKPNGMIARTYRTYRVNYDAENRHQGCFGDLAETLAPCGPQPLHEHHRGKGGRGVEGALRPRKSGDYIVFDAEQDLIIAGRLLGAPLQQLRLQADPL